MTESKYKRALNAGLQLAIKKGDIDMTRILLVAGANPLTAYENHPNGLFHAVDTLNLKLFNLILEFINLDNYKYAKIFLYIMNSIDNDDYLKMKLSGSKIACLMTPFVQRTILKKLEFCHAIFYARKVLCKQKITCVKSKMYKLSVDNCYRIAFKKYVKYSVCFNFVKICELSYNCIFDDSEMNVTILNYLILVHNTKMIKTFVINYDILNYISELEPILKLLVDKNKKDILNIITGCMNEYDKL